MPIAIVSPCQAIVIGPISIVGSIPIVITETLALISKRQYDALPARKRSRRPLGAQLDAGRREHHSGGDRDGHHVIDRGPAEILLHLAHGGAGELHGGATSSGSD